MLATLANLKRLLAANPAVDWRAIQIHAVGACAKLVSGGGEAGAATSVLLAYQRILHILPFSEDQRAIPLLESGLHSAIQIAGMPQHQFERHWASLFPGEEALGLRVYRAALARRSALLHRHISEIQRNEPHYRAARFK